MKIMVSLNGGVDYVAATNGVRVWVDLESPEEGASTELSINLTHEGVITDVIQRTDSNDKEQVVATDSVLYDDIVMRLWSAEGDTE